MTYISISFTLSKLLVGEGGGGTAIVLSRFYLARGGCRILIKHEIRKFIISTVETVCKPFREQGVAKKPNKLKNCAWFLK